MSKIYIEKDGLPYIEADNNSVVFGFGEKSIEYTWAEIKEVVENDMEQWRRSPHADMNKKSPEPDRNCDKDWFSETC